MKERKINPPAAAASPVPQSIDPFRLLEAVKDHALVCLDLSGAVTTWNAGAECLTGYASAEIIGQHLARLYPAEEAAAGKPQRALQATLAAGRYDEEGQRVRKDGSRFWARLTLTALRDPAGAHVGFAVLMSDITGHKRAESELQESRDRYRSLFENMLEGFAYCRMLFEEGQPTDFIYLEVNRAFEHLTGLIDVAGKKVSEVIPGVQQTNPELFEIYGRVASTGQPERFEAYLDSLAIWFSVAVYSPQEGYFVAIFDNVTGRKNTEQALQEKEERYRRLFDEALEGIGLADVETGIILDCNRAFLELTGYEKSELIGRPQIMLHPPQSGQRQFSHCFAQHCGEKQGQVIEDRLLTKSGLIKEVEIKATMMEFGGRKVLRGSFRDITEERRGRREREITLALLRLLNDRKDLHELVQAILATVQRWTGCEAIGLRLQEGEDYPYYETRGFPGEFVRLENHLCARDPGGRILRETSGDPVLECMCGNVLCGRFNPALPFFTPQGSFWTNSTSKLLGTTGETELLGRTRDRCNGEGYESVALIPLGHGKQILGLLQLNDRAPGRFTPELIAFLEQLGDQIAVAIAQRQAAAALRESEEKYRQIVETAHEGIWSADGDSRTTFVNRHLATMLDYAPEEMLGKKIEEFMFAEDLAAHRVLMEKRRRGERSAPYERRLRRKDGSVVWAIVSVTPLMGPEGRFVGSFAMLTDITERKQAEEALRMTQFSVDHAADGLLWVAPDARIISVNEAACRTLGYTRAELLKLSIPEIDLEHTPEVWLRFWVELKTRGAVSFESRQRAKDGRIIPVEITANFIEFAGKEFSCGFVRDISERRRAEAERRKLETRLQQSQKLEAIGQLAGSVAHDFNNLLTVILGYSDMLLTKLNPDNPNRAYIAEIKDAGERASSLTRQLLAFSRNQVLAPKVLDLNAAVSAIEKMLRRLIGEDILLTTILSPLVHRVLVDPGQMDQVIVNLAVNARDAMPQGGRLTIETRPADLDEAFCRLHPGSLPGHCTLLALTDTGCGMTPEVQGRIYEPFFTTKEAGKGTGLGLATVFGIVKQSEGCLEVESSVGVGTCFKIYLPAVEPQDAAAPFAIGPGAAQCGSETILLVEDEELVRRLTRFALKTYGYRVLEASDGPRALTIVEETPGPIHLLLTDVVMPEMNGRQLAEALHGRRPELKVIYMSGYTDDTIVRSGLIEADVAYLHKPFSPQDLAHKVREVLDRKD